jgi:hypothetical protein
MSESTPKIKECTVGSFWQVPAYEANEVSLHLQLNLKFEQPTTKTCDMKLPSAWYNEWDSIAPTPIPITTLSDIKHTSPTQNLQKALDSLKKKTEAKELLQEAIDNYLKSKYGNLL